MTVTTSTIKEMFPEFKSKSDDFVNIYIKSAKSLICSGAYGDKYDLALSYLTAHLMRLTTQEGGEITREKVGDLSRSYREIIGQGGGAQGYALTGYGKQFLSIKKSLVKLSLRPIYGSPL